jgi:hypothetical protein
MNFQRSVNKLAEEMMLERTCKDDSTATRAGNSKESYFRFIVILQVIALKGSRCRAALNARLIHKPKLVISEAHETVRYPEAE